MVVFILIGATVFSLVFQGVNGGRWIEHLLSSRLPGGVVGFLIFVNVFIFFLAFFLDFFEIVFIVVPMLVPVAHALDINMIWFGLLLCVNMQTSFMHPPFGFALFYLRAIAPKEVKTNDIYWGSLPVDRAAAPARRRPDLLAGVGHLLDRRRTRRSTQQARRARRSRSSRCPAPAATSARPTSTSPPALDLSRSPTKP